MYNRDCHLNRTRLKILGFFAIVQPLELRPWLDLAFLCLTLQLWPLFARNSTLPQKENFRSLSKLLDKHKNQIRKIVERVERRTRNRPLELVLIIIVIQHYHTSSIIVFSPPAHLMAFKGQDGRLSLSGKSIWSFFLRFSVFVVFSLHFGSACLHSSSS
jgi:hypothetical protein